MAKSQKNVVDFNPTSTQKENKKITRLKKAKAPIYSDGLPTLSEPDDDIDADTTIVEVEVSNENIINISSDDSKSIREGYAQKEDIEKNFRLNAEIKELFDILGVTNIFVIEKCIKHIVLSQVYHKLKYDRSGKELLVKYYAYSKFNTNQKKMYFVEGVKFNKNELECLKKSFTFGGQKNYYQHDLDLVDSILKIMNRAVVTLDDVKNISHNNYAKLNNLSKFVEMISWQNEDKESKYLLGDKESIFDAITEQMLLDRIIKLEAVTMAKRIKDILSTIQVNENIKDFLEMAKSNFVNKINKKLDFILAFSE